MRESGGRRRSAGTAGPALVLALGAALSLGACATLGQVLGVEPPRFEGVSNRTSTLRLSPPSTSYPRGSATVRLWTRVTNPNAFGLTLSTLEGTLGLEGRDLADVDLPLGLPLQAGADTVLPIEMTLGFDRFSDLGDAARRLLSGDDVAYELSGILGIEAGPLGEQRVGPRTWLTGTVDVTSLLGDRPDGP